MPPADYPPAQALSAAPEHTVRSPWSQVLQAAAALAAGMGVGRFVYTPILPLMQAQAGLSASAGANLATANYVGYLAGALAGILLPGLARSRAVLRRSLILLTVTLLAMPLTHAVAVWWVLRLLAGAASAVVFVIAVSSLLSHLRGHPAHLPGWGLGGVGAGIALSGTLVLILRSMGDWRSAWWASAALAAVLAAGSWTLRPETSRAPAGGSVGAARPARRPHSDRWFSLLFTCYALEGVGYIIAGTFLVAAIEQMSPGWIGDGAWILVGLAAIPSSAVWAWLSRRWSRPDLLLAALVVQAVAIALPAVLAGAAAAVISAALFGATFLGIATMALAAGAHLQFPRSVALLTVGYSFGQVLGPLVVTPLLHHGYHQALLLAVLVVLAAAAAAGILRVGFPSQLPAAYQPTDQSGSRDLPA
jgi:MFS family permease